MGEVSCPAKLTRPSISACLPRERLFRALDAGRRRQIVWIGAPAGSGKTTLASSYVDARRLPTVWYQVDEGDADPATLFHYLGVAARLAAPRRRKPLPVLTPEYLPGLPAFARRFFEDFLGRLKAPAVLVFDNCQRVPADAPFHAAILEAASRLPEGMSLILASREAPPPPYARRRANEGMELVGWRELRLTPEEAEGIARIRGRGGAAARSVDTLHARAGGWAAGLVLLMEAERLGEVVPSDLQRRPPDEVLDYFGCEVLQSLDAGMRGFLLRSAFLPHMTAPMAAAVTGAEHAGRILAQLHRQNHFTQRHPVDEPVYEYHALFRDFLLARAAETFPPEEMRRLRREAAQQLEIAGRIEDAAALFREAGDAQGLARIVMTQAQELLAQGRSRTLLEWIGHIPAEAVEGNPWLQCWKGLCQLPVAPQEARLVLEKAYGLFRQARDGTGALFAWSGLADAILFAGEGGERRFDHLISEMGALVREHGDFPSVQVETRVTSSMMKALFASGRSREMEPWAERAATISRSTAPMHLRVEALFTLALSLFARGRHAEFDSVMGMLQPFLQSPEAPALPRLTAIWMRAAMSVMAAQFDRCVELANEGLALAETSGVHLVDAMFLGNAALAQLHLRNFSVARDLLTRMEGLTAAPGPSPLDYFHFLAACEGLAIGNTSLAARHAEIAKRLTSTLGDGNTRPMKSLLMALVAHARGAAAECRSHLSEARDQVAETGPIPVSVQCGLVAAYLGLQEGRVDAKDLVPVLTGAREFGHFTAYIPMPGLLERVASAALEAGIEVEFAREIIRRNRLRPDPACADLEQWPWPVKVRTLGRFELLREERPVEFPRKVQQKPLLLLKALIAAGGREVPEERLVDALWPEAEGDLGHQAFTAALHRLRKLVGVEEALVLREGRLSLADAVCWVDVRAFDRRLARAAETSGSGRAAAARASHLERALALYRGPLLPEETNGLDVSAPRERLRRAMLRAAEELGGIRERERRWEDAVACYRVAFDADESSAAFCRKLVAACLKSGREAEAARATRRCERARAAAGRPGLPPELTALLGDRRATTS